MFKAGQMVKRIEDLRWWELHGFDPEKRYKIIKAGDTILEFYSPNGGAPVKALARKFKGDCFDKYVERMLNV